VSADRAAIAIEEATDAGPPVTARRRDGSRSRRAARSRNAIPSDGGGIGKSDTND
jgi:hypothetical protein